MEKEKFKELEKFFVIDEKYEQKKDYKVYKLNEEISLKFESCQEAAKFLEEVIRFWVGVKARQRKDQIVLFCGEYIWGNKTLKPEDEWIFSYKTPSTCSRCVRAQRVLRLIFGNEDKFNALPFVKYEGDRYYKFEFRLLKFFAKYGERETVEELKKEAEEERRKKIEKKKLQQQLQRKKNKEKLFGLLNGTEVSNAALEWILDLMERKTVYLIKAPHPDLVVCKTERSEWGNSGGIGYFDQIYIYYYGQTDMKEWQWRDRWSAERDRWDLRINDIGEIKKVKSKGKVEVELVNKEFGNRYVEFYFDKPNEPEKEERLLNEKEQAEFIVAFEEEMMKILEEAEKNWELKPKMLASYEGNIIVPTGAPTYIYYRKPSIKQRVVKNGVAAFILEEQVDHRVSDPQMRYKLFIYSKDKKVRMVFEDHSYERMEGSALVTLIDLSFSRVIINTRRGKKEIKI